MIETIETIKLPYHWSPRPYQRASWNYLSNGGKRCVKLWHRRSGKDEEDLNNICCAMEEVVGTYWYMLPEYSQARKAMWDAIDRHTGLRRVDKIFPRELRHQNGGTKEQEMFIRWHNGSTFQLVGADNFHSLVGSPPIGIVFSEYARTNPSAWAYLMPILEENGGWACFNSTPYGDNHFRGLCDLAANTPGWFFEKLTVDETNIFSKEQLAQILKELQELYGEDYGYALYLQEYYCSFDAAVPGSIWGDCLDRCQREDRILDYQIAKEIPVDTAWDLGRTDDTSIGFFQMYDQRVDVFDHHASSLKEVDFYVEVLRQKRLEHGLTYGTHYLPHDARPRRLGMGGKSIYQQLLDHTKREPYLGRFVIQPMLDKQEGIQAARKTFQCTRFHDTRTAALRKSLRHYHRQWDDEKKMFKDTPEHDWASHDADMFRGLSLAWRERKEKPKEPSILAQIQEREVKKFTFGHMKQSHFKKRRAMREWAGHA